MSENERLTVIRWRSLIACCIANLSLGSIYSWSVFAAAMGGYLSDLSGTTVTTGDLAIVYTVANAVGPITMISGGYFNDRFGPRKVMIAGGMLFGGGMILSGFATSVSFLIITYGLCSGLGLGMAYGCTINSCVKLFPDKKGLIGGLTTATYGMASVILPPIITTLVAVYNPAIAFKIIGSVFLIVICCCAMFVRGCPADFVPVGWNEKSTSGRGGNNETDWKGMLRSRSFYLMMLLLMCGAFSGMMIMSQASSLASEMMGLSVGAAGLTVSVLAFFNACGRLIAGTASDIIGRANTLALACVFSVIGLGLLFLCGNGNRIMFFVGIAIVGICFGSFMGVFPGFTADRFGRRNNSVNYGIMFIGFAMAGLFGPMAMRSVFASDGSYARAFLIAGALSVAGILLAFACRREVSR